VSTPTPCLTAIRSIVSAASSTTCTADSKGGVYFTHGGLFYADPKGVVKQYGEGLRTNGVVLSPDEKVVYVTNANSLRRSTCRPMAR
jgi:sugar lactone lactonase YvrE